MTLLRPFLAGRRKSQRTVSNSCTPNKSHCDVHHCSTRTPIYRRLNPSSKSTIRKNTSRRCVRSKPPKLMPGGRIITSGQGTLTEVSKSFYVAYGMTSLQTTDSGIHLVVPVKDELQEITDDEFEISPRTMEKPVLGKTSRFRIDVILFCRFFVWFVVRFAKNVDGNRGE